MPLLLRKPTLEVIIDWGGYFEPIGCSGLRLQPLHPAKDGEEVIQNQGRYRSHAC